jgi:hypothetical protein
MDIYSPNVDGHPKTYKLDDLCNLKRPRHFKTHLPLPFVPDEIWEKKPKVRNTIDEKWIKIIQVVYETLPRLNIKFSLYFAHFCA